MGHSYGQLSQEERLEIYHCYRSGWPMRRIARHLNRAASTISREMWRNGRRHSSWPGGYCPVRAQRLARRRRQIDKSRFKLVRQPGLQALVREYLAMGWSPQQIAGRLARAHGAPRVSHESIYRYIYYRREQKDYLCRLLPQARSRRRSRCKAGGRVPRIPGRTAISKRPASVETRMEPGHWEADMMLFSHPAHGLLVTCERTSRYLIASRLTGRKAATIVTALIQRFARLPPAARRSVTFDNGSEFWLHLRLAQACRLKTFFCDPHAPWQKGSVENAIGRLRRYLPRKTVLANLSPQTLREIINDYNSTPRACLDYKTPQEVYSTRTVALHM